MPCHVMNVYFRSEDADQVLDSLLACSMRVVIRGAYRRTSSSQQAPSLEGSSGAGTMQEVRWNVTVLLLPPERVAALLRVHESQW